MPISRETKQKMKQMQEQPVSRPEDMVEPKQGWQCPVCGSVYDKEGICPVDEALLLEVEKWSEAAPTSEGTSTEEVMETGDELYPADGR